MKRLAKILTYAMLGLIGLTAWAVHAERRAGAAARDLCAGIPIGMPAAEARRAVAAAEGLDRRLDTPTGILAIFSGAFMYSRHTCEIELAERVTATRLGHLD
jgi:hypothetical protein